ncbi:MAG: hypothetical protein JRN10_00210 [Nitrososphaerota archaeon]|jgi:hypothetical protein|nr:hypothetical protein [Nitrososphaerota archaeon]MDG6929660.1 hypothetical protein [Nitrososphaerota archaeon]
MNKGAGKNRKSNYGIKSGVETSKSRKAKLRKLKQEREQIKRDMIRTINETMELVNSIQSRMERSL